MKSKISINPEQVTVITNTVKPEIFVRR